jgi:hypothetical protein
MSMTVPIVATAMATPSDRREGMTVSAAVDMGDIVLNADSRQQ